MGGCAPDNGRSRVATSVAYHDMKLDGVPTKRDVRRGLEVNRGHTEVEY